MHCHLPLLLQMHSHGGCSMRTVDCLPARAPAPVWCRPGRCLPFARLGCGGGTGRPPLSPPGRRMPAALLQPRSHWRAPATGGAARTLHLGLTCERSFCCAQGRCEKGASVLLIVTKLHAPCVMLKAAVPRATLPSGVCSAQCSQDADIRLEGRPGSKHSIMAAWIRGMGATRQARHCRLCTACMGLVAWRASQARHPAPGSGRSQAAAEGRAPLVRQANSTLLKRLRSAGEAGRRAGCARQGSSAI